MPTNFPTSLDSPTDPVGTDPLSSGHAAQHDFANDAIVALETKLGIGASTPPASGAVLRRTGTGSSGWGALVDADVSASAAIAKSKLAALGIVDADVAAAGTANIAVGKLAAAGSANQVLITPASAPAVWGQVATAMIAASAISQWGASAGTGGSTIHSTLMTPIPGTSVALTTTGGLVFWVVTGASFCDTANVLVQYQLMLDGSPVGPFVALTCPAVSAYHGFCVAMVAQPAAGAHTFGAAWANGSAPPTTTLSNCVVYAVEIKK